MKRASIRSRLIMAAVLAAILSSLAPAGSATISTRAQREQRAQQATKVTLANTAEVRVTAGPTGALIEWRTSFELDNLGFNIYRDQDGTRTQVNPAIIAGSALIVGQGTPLYAGYTYRWFDAGGSLACRYYVEDVDLKGAKTLNGPFTPSWSQSLAKSQSALTVSDVAATQAALATQVGGPSGTLDQQMIEPASIQDQWAIAAQPGLKIGVKQNGWYRVTQPEMAAAGFDTSADAGNLRLFVDAREVPIEVSRTSGPLTATDYLEFYGTGLDTPTTDTHVYYLLNGSQAGLRVPVFGEVQANVSPNASPSLAPIVQPASTGTSVSTGAWFGDVSSGVAAEKEERKNNTIAEDQPRVESAPDETNSKANRQTADPLSNASEPEPATKRTNEVQPSVPAIKDESKTTLSSAGPRPTSQTMRGRHSVKNRRRQKSLSHRRNHALAALATVSPTSGFLYDVQLKERFVYFSSLLNGPAENYFGGSLLTPPTTKTLTLANLQTDSQATAFLRIGLQGTSFEAHLVNVLVNGVMVGAMSFDSQQYAEQTFNLTVSLLHQGDNEIKFVIAGDSGDHSLFSYARLTYPKTYHANSDALSFALRSAQSATIDGFTTSSVRVLDVSDPNSVQEIRAGVENSGAGFALTIPASGAKAKGSRIMLAQATSSFLHPASLVFNQPSTLNQATNPSNGNSADLLIIANKSFIPSLTSVLPGTTTSLVALRQSQGYSVKVLDVEDVFDEFSYGMHTPQAITDFLSRARTTWVNAPRYLMLVGDASYDPRNYEGLGNFDLVPTKLIDTVFLETGSDDTLTDFDGDGIPEIPVGRLPVRTVAEANLVISKIVNFSPGNVPQNALMVADTQGSYFFNFEDANDQLSNNFLVPAGISVQKVYRRLESSDATARTDIINKINSGMALVNYSGHGNVDVWTGAPIFSTTDAMALTNGNKLPLVIVMDCLNGYFVAPPSDCLSEALLKAPNGGAVASFSSSGLTIPTGQHQMDQQLFQSLYDGPPIALGDATRLAKAATTDTDVRRTWILFGDPTMKIR